jgi:hypothetical protein
LALAGFRGAVGDAEVAVLGADASLRCRSSSLDRQDGAEREGAYQLTGWLSPYSGRGSLRANVSPSRVYRSPPPHRADLGRGGDARGLGGLAEVSRIRYGSYHLGNEGDDAHRRATAGGRRAGRLASSARQAGPSLGLAFIDASEQHGSEIAGTGTWLGGGRIAPFGRRWERRVMEGSRHGIPARRSLRHGGEHEA